MRFILFIIFAGLISNPIIADELYTNTIVNDCGNFYSLSAVYEIISYNCAYGYFLPAGATACTSCPSGFTCAGGTFEFNPYITQGLDVGDRLVQNSPYACGNFYSLSAIYEPISYNCSAGYFLPAGATSCVSCPSGFTCAGGTFEFDANTTQGLDAGDILIQNANNSCSNDFVQSFHAIFEPNTMTLNFDDGNGNVTSTTCEYGDTITIPDTVPTRTGYNFTGWKVRTEE